MTFQRYLPTVFQHCFPTPSNPIVTGFQRVFPDTLLLRSRQALALGSYAPVYLVPMPRLGSRGGVAGRAIAFALCGSEVAPC